MAFLKKLKAAFLDGDAAQEAAAEGVMIDMERCVSNVLKTRRLHPEQTGEHPESYIGWLGSFSVTDLLGNKFRTMTPEIAKAFEEKIKILGETCNKNGLSLSAHIEQSLIGTDAFVAFQIMLDPNPSTKIESWMDAKEPFNPSPKQDHRLYP